MLHVVEIMARKPERLSLVAAVFFTLCVTAYWLLARSPMKCEGLGDCVKYMAMAESFRSWQFNEIDSPFNARVLTPWVSSLFPTSITQGFLATNALASVVFVVAWHGIARHLNLRNIEFASLLVWFFLHPLGFSLYHSTPGSADPLAHAMLGLTTWAYLRRHPTLPLVLMLGLLTKESFTFIGLIMVLAEAVRMGLAGSGRMAPSLRIIGGVIAVLLLHKWLVSLIDLRLFPPTDGFKPSTLDTVRYFWEAAKQDPPRFVVWATAFLCVVGAFPMLMVRPWRTPVSGLSASISVYFCIGGAGFVALGLVGGSDMSRIIFTGDFLIMCALLYSLGQKLPSVWSTLAATLLSLGVALSYTRLLPATLEYDYYMNDHRLEPTLTVLAGSLLVLLLGIAISWRMLNRQPT